MKLEWIDLEKPHGMPVEAVIKAHLSAVAIAGGVLLGATVLVAAVARLIAL